MLDTGHENVHRNVCKATKEVDEVATQRGKASIFTRKLREREPTAWIAFFCVSLRVSTALCWKEFAGAETSVVNCWRKRRNRGWSVNEYVAMLNLCPGKGIIDWVRQGDDGTRHFQAIS